MLSAKTFFVFATSFLAFFSVDYASADGKTDQDLLNVLGKKYEFQSSDGKLDSFLRLIKVSNDDIKKAKESHALITLTFDNGQYTLTGSADGIAEHSMTFKIGEEFSMNVLKKDIKVTFTQEKNVLKQATNWDDGKSKVFCTYTFTPDKLTVNVQVGRTNSVQTFVPKQ